LDWKKPRDKRSGKQFQLFLKTQLSWKEVVVIGYGSVKRKMQPEQ
jgi:hypothetical protein